MGARSNELKIMTPSDKEIVMTREFDAPRDLVFEAHTSCEHLSRWWGPRKYEFAKCEIDFRPGGSWRIVHRGPDGEEYAFHGEYREIAPPEQIVWTFEFEGFPGSVSVETLTLEEHDGRTTLTATSVYNTVEERDGMLQSGMAEGATETMERLDEYLEVLKAGTAR
ncbi:MAG: SRPBCC family protein [Actinomycetota bacterium]|nr:SRPBCC family protein [Actinomycetota bacterium]